jgi:hypothetical protein
VYLVPGDGQPGFIDSAPLALNLIPVKPRPAVRALVAYQVWAVSFGVYRRPAVAVEVLGASNIANQTFERKQTMTTAIRNWVGRLAVLLTLLYSGWLAVIGTYANLALLRTGYFSISDTALINASVGTLGVASCIAMIWFPRRGSIGAVFAMVSIAGIHLYNLAAKYKFEFLRSILEQLTVPILLATVLCLVFVLAPDVEVVERRSDT